MSPVAAELWNRAANATLGEILIAVGFSALMIGASVAITAVVLVRVPADYFVSDKQPLPLEGRAAWLRVGARILRNFAGLALVLLGLLLSLPGVPGQGLLTILLGLMLLDVPGKRRLEAAIVRRPGVHRAINKLRARFGRPPILLPGPPPISSDDVARARGG